MKKLWIDPGCITCGLCEFVAPEVFEVTDISHIKKNVKASDHSDAIEEAKEGCPVKVIRYEEKK